MEQFNGWYEAPFPFGKTDFSLVVITCSGDGEFTGTGQDKQGEFTVKGKIDGSKVSFVKDYKDGSHTNVQYEGTVDNDHIDGQYYYLYKTFLVNMKVQEKFYMKLTE